MHAQKAETIPERWARKYLRAQFREREYLVPFLLAGGPHGDGAGSTLDAYRRKGPWSQRLERAMTLGIVLACVLAVLMCLGGIFLGGADRRQTLLFLVPTVIAAFLAFLYQAGWRCMRRHRRKRRRGSTGQRS